MAMSQEEGSVNPRYLEHVANRLAFLAAGAGLSEFDVHEIVRDAFRLVHAKDMRKLQKKLDTVIKNAPSRDGESLIEKAFRQS